MTEEPKPEQQPPKIPEETSVAVYEISRWQLYLIIGLVLISLFTILFSVLVVNHSKEIPVGPHSDFLVFADSLKLDVDKFSICLDSGKYEFQINSEYESGINMTVQGTPTFFINGRVIEGAKPYSDFIYAIELELKNTSPNELVEKWAKEGIGLGNKNAPVKIVEFSDFQCPFCSKFWQETEFRLRKDYVDTGKVYFVYRNFPLKNIHPRAETAAEAALCANEQGKFWEYHDTLFNYQNIWAK